MIMKAQIGEIAVTKDGRTVTIKQVYRNRSRVMITTTGGVYMAWDLRRVEGKVKQ